MENRYICFGPNPFGYHWLQEVVHMLKTKTLERTNWTALQTSIELKAIREDHKPTESNIVQTHFTPDVIPEKLRNAKTIFMYRNPKDVVYSYFQIRRFYGFEGSFEEFVDCCLEGEVLYGSWFDHTLQWEAWSKDHDILIISYENMTQNPIGTLQQIANYLQIDVDKDFLEKVKEACEFQKMEDKKEVVQHKVIGDITLRPLRKGKVGDWKNHLTVALNEKFDQIFEEKMKTSNLEFKFEI